MSRALSKPEHILVLVATGIVAFLFVWFQWELLFLAFAGLLVSVAFESIASWMGRHARLNPALSYIVTLLLLAALVAGTALLLVPRVTSEVSQLATVVPKSLHQAKSYLDRTAWGLGLLRLLDRAMQGNSIHLTAIAKSIVRGAADLVVVVVIGFFGALNPSGYREGLLALIPEEHRGEARELTQEIAITLRYWLLGQLVPMVVLGICSVIGLWLLHVPLAISVGLFTGLMIFMPYVGSVLSGLLAVLLALERGPQTALWVLLLYCCIHLCEGYLLTPFVQKKAVRLPPVLTILSQFCLWSFAGILGVAVAAPLTAVGLVLVKRTFLRRPPPKSLQPEIAAAHPISTDDNPAAAS